MTALLAAIAVVVVGAFAAGSIVNVRRATALMRWMQGGLPRLGERTTVRWLGTTAVELVVKDARAPFRSVTLIVFLEPRDMPWLWAIARRRGRRDTLILRGLLRTAPAEELEVLDRASWSGREALRRVEVEGWQVRESGAGGVAVYHRGPAALARADALVERARGSGLAPLRLSVRPTEPHFQLHVAPPSASSSAPDFFEAVRALAALATASVRSSSISP